MRKQHFRLPPWQRKPTASETAPDIADSELVPSESAAQPTRHKHGKRTYVIGGVLLALAIAAAVALYGGVLRRLKEHGGWFAAAILLTAGYILLTIIRPGGALFEAAMGIPF